MLERPSEVGGRKVNQPCQLLKAHVCIEMLAQVLSRSPHLPRRETASRPDVVRTALASDTKQGEDQRANRLISEKRAERMTSNALLPQTTGKRRDEVVAKRIGV